MSSIFANIFCTTELNLLNSINPEIFIGFQYKISVPDSSKTFISGLKKEFIFQDLYL